MTRLQNLISNINSDKVYIQTHNFPDPDAIASAYALKTLLEMRGVESVICYKGRCDRSTAQNMVNALNIDMVNIEDLNMNSKAEIILVDAQKGNANIVDLVGDETICIDHHPTYEEVSYRYSDIRPEVGACATIIASYYLEEGIEIPRDVATALMYGIKIDTANMSRGVSKLDMEVFNKIYWLCDTSMLRSLDSSRLVFEDLKAYAAAIDSISIYGDMSFATAGENCPESLIATISDFVLAIDEVFLSVVYSIKNDGVKLSVRSDNPMYDAGKITNEALKGIGNGGGHPTMAGGFVFFQLDMSVEVLIDTIRERFVEAARFHS